MKAMAYDDPKKAPIYMAFAFGFAAETVAGIIAYPIDTVSIEGGVFSKISNFLERILTEHIESKNSLNF